MWQDTRLTQKKTVTFPYTDVKWTEQEIREASPITIATNSIKYLGVILTKFWRNLYDKNFKSLKKEIKEDIRKWKAL